MEKGVAEFMRQFSEENDFIMREATKRVSNSIVRLAPVDEGEYVADWDVKIGGWPADSEQEPDPNKRRTRARLQETLGAVKYGDAVFFENDDPVAVRLEYGYSKQAPQGVVRLTARRWRGFVKGAATAALNKIKKRMMSE